VITRMAYGNDGYAPISLPEKIDVLPPYGPPIPFDSTAVARALADADSCSDRPLSYSQSVSLKMQRRFIKDMQKLVRAANGTRTDRVALVLDTVWWRRVVYFVSLGLGLVAGAYPLLQQYLRIPGVTDGLNDRAGGPTGWAIGLIKGFLPGFAEPWLAAIVSNPAGAVLILIGLLASLKFSGFLRSRICDRARAAWNVRQGVDGISIRHLVLTGQRHALTKGAILFAAIAAGIWMLGSSKHWRLFAFFAVLSFACLVFRLYRIRVPPGKIDPANPGILLGLARKVRQSEVAVVCYRFIARTVAPAIFLLLCTLIAASVAHRAVFDLLSTGGSYCHSTLKAEDQSSRNEKLGTGLVFPTNSVCHATGLRLIAGRKYRIRLDMDDDWFDKGVRTDVGGFVANSVPIYMVAALKRWRQENWFQPIARIGELGNYEHVLQPAAPLPVVDFSRCQPSQEKHLSGWDAIKDTRNPVSAEFKQTQLNCEAKEGIRPSRTLISDITADATGELFIYVNDAVLMLPSLTDAFYRNNSGTATVTVKRILATPVIEAEQEATGQVNPRRWELSWQ
jgi:hypothetical protein